MSSKPIAVTDDSFEADVLKADKPVLVDFWAPWCGPCRTVAPVLEELAEDYADKIVVAKVNTDESQQRAMELGVQGIPTMIFFRGGQEVDRVVGAFPKAALADRITTVLGQSTPEA